MSGLKGWTGLSQERPAEASGIDGVKSAPSALLGDLCLFLFLPRLGWKTFKAKASPHPLPCSEKVGNPHKVHRAHVTHQSAFVLTISNKPHFTKKNLRRREP